MAASFFRLGSQWMVREYGVMGAGIRIRTVSSCNRVACPEGGARIVSPPPQDLDLDRLLIDVARRNGDEVQEQLLILLISQRRGQISHNSTIPGHIYAAEIQGCIHGVCSKTLADPA
jgi:hypothetical protein